ncbi:MAG: nitrite reductase large subunit NirB [Candidatus Hydrogenedentota bacterium]
MSNVRKNIIVIGNGMVGHRFCEKLVEFGALETFKVTVFGDEPRRAYDRVHLSSYFEEDKSDDDLYLCAADWYTENGLDLRIGTKATRIDRDKKRVYTDDNDGLDYDYIVLATGSSAFIPPVPGIDKQGIFAYRTIEDLDAITAYAKNAKRAAVMGGGLLGLEAAKAVLDLGLETHVIEFAPRLMPRQLDESGAGLLKSKIEAMGVDVHLSKQTMAVLGNEKIEGLLYACGESLDIDMLVVSAGIRPRDEIAKVSGIKVGERGGILVDDALRTSDPNIFAIGEVALHDKMIYGLIGPGYRMAEVVASNLLGDSLEFTGWDMSTKLKLLGVDVASFGDPFATEGTQEVAVQDEVGGVYKKLVVHTESNRLVGGVLVGDASDYATLLHLTNTGDALEGSAADLVIGKSDALSGDASSLPDALVACSCNTITKGEICSAIDANELTTPAQVKSCTNAGTGCGGCMPLVTDILMAQLKASGKNVKQVICEHFAYTRQELLGIMKVKELRSYEAMLNECGTGEGCEICKPLVASLLASTWNDAILTHSTIQDTNDKFLANIQQGGTYSVIPRIAGGEPTAENLIVLGQVAKKYDLYCKITGGQRIGLYGARVEQLPQIWAELIAAGFESGHAYGKALRTVKSCVGTSWCRYGVQDSTTMAIDVENRYKGLRSPHKLKSAVSGCTRECAEAQSKDFGFIATEKGWNLYVCGNGGTTPRHADLLASDLDTDTAIRYIDRFLMYYVRTAGPLVRTARWIEKLEGGIEHLKDVVIHDSLGIAEELEAEMEAIVQTYRCEWKDVVENPSKRDRFQHFANNESKDETVSFVRERGQIRTPDWFNEALPEETVTDGDAIAIREGMEDAKTCWEAGSVSDFPENGGIALKYGSVQIALFHFASRGTWYATQNLCPHKRDMVLARGLTGDVEGIPKVACPHHKKQFSLETGECLSGDPYKLKTFPVRVEGDKVYIELPERSALIGDACDNETACDALAEAANTGV